MKSAYESSKWKSLLQQRIAWSMIKFGKTINHMDRLHTGLHNTLWIQEYKNIAHIKLENCNSGKVKMKSLYSTGNKYVSLV